MWHSPQWPRTSSATQLGAAFFTFGSAPVVSENQALDTIAETISIHALIRPDTITGTDTIIRKHQAWGLHLVDGVVTFVYRDGGGVDRSVAGPTVTAGGMSQLVVIDDGTNINFYLNGTKTSAARVGTAGYTQNAFRVQLGAYFGEATNSNFFDGRMDEVAVWNQPLTQQMVLAYWQAATEGTFGTVMLGSPKYPRLKLEMAYRL